jgi:hypothetical protein
MPKLSRLLPIALVLSSLAACSQPAAGPFTVEGRVVTLFGVPQAGANVRIGSTTVTTGADGTFTVADVSAPYDLIVFGTFGAHVFMGMTSPSPEVLAVVTELDPPVEATIEGSLPMAIPADAGVVVCVEGLDRPAFGCSFATEGADAYSVNVLWLDGIERSIRLHVLAVTDPMGTISFTGAATSDLTVTAGGVFTRDVATFDAAPASATITATITTAPGLTPSSAVVATRLGGGSSMTVGYPPVAGGTLTQSVPRIASQTYDVVARATGIGQDAVAWRVGVAPGAALDLVIPGPAVLTTPADAASGVMAGTTFASVGGSGVHTFIFESGPAIFHVSTTQSAITFPDFADLGIDLPFTDTVSWFVVTHGGSTTVEQASVGWFEDYITLSFGLDAGFGLDADGSFGRSDVRSFTIAP